MPATTSVALDQVLQDFFEAVDSIDVDRIAGYLAEDTQSVDELSRGWLRGRANLEEYLRLIKNSVAGIESRLSSVQITEWGDTGLITCVLEQTYRIGGEEQQIRAPTSIVCRREDGDWKAVLFHSVPLPE